jgi:hypothetical protein
LNDAASMPMPAERYRFELGHDRRQHAESKRGRHQVIVGGHALGLDPSRSGIDRHDVVEFPDVETLSFRPCRIAKEVGRVLAQSKHAARACFDGIEQTVPTRRIVAVTDDRRCAAPHTARRSDHYADAVVR